MLKCDAVVIGGTGIGDRLGEFGFSPVHIPTAYGMQRGLMGEFRGAKVLAIQRHSAGHKVPPHRINYRAIADAIRRVSAKAVFSSAAVGSLRADWGPGTLVCCDQFIDLTCRSVTMHERQVQHVDFSHGFAAHSTLFKSCNQSGAEIQPAGVYVGLDGPRYETPAEILMLQRLPGDVVGMTASTEAEVIQEVGVPYACLAIVTNLGAGMAAGELNHGEVTDVMKVHGKRVLDILFGACAMAANNNGS